MKIAVFADLHNSRSGMDEVSQIVAREKPQKIVFCGDLFGGHGDCKAIAEAAQSLDGTLYFVHGNNDWSGERFLNGGMEDYVVMYHFGRTLFFTHGDRYDKYRPPVLLKDGDVLVYGHTHMALLQRHNGLYVVNVGSMALPRDGTACYALLDEGGIELKRLDGTVLTKLPFSEH